MIPAFFKLSLKDRVVIIITAIAALVTVVVLFYKLISGSLVDFSGFPESILQDTPKLQTYHWYEYKDLPTEVQFPGTDYGVCVGGEELPASQYGAAFKYADDTYIIVSELQRGETTADYVAAHMYALVNGEKADIPGDYTVKVHDEGYLNTLPIEYEGGILKVKGAAKTYVLTYRVRVEDNDFLLAFACHQKTGLQKCFYLLNHVLCTLVDFRGEPETDGNGNNSTDTGNTGSADVSAPTIELIGEERTYETLDDVLEQQARDEYALANPGAVSIEENLQVSDELSGETVVFVFEYTYGVAMPSYAILKSPSGVEYAPDYFNKENDGRIMFIVEKPEVGTWTITVADDIEMGAYVSHVFRYMDYMDIIKETPVTETGVSDNEP